MDKEKIVELALRYEGVCPSNRKDEYLDLLTRGGQESKQTTIDMLHMSSCALVVRGLWYKLGVRHACLTRPYQIGAAPKDVLTVASYFNAVMDGRKIGKMPDDWDRDNPYTEPCHPEEGDSFYILYSSNGRGEHFGTVTKFIKLDNDAMEFESIDGGQGNGGIMKVKRQFIKRGQFWVDKKSGRSLLYWFDANNLIVSA